MKDNLHWPYYLAIESDLDSISRYVEFDEENYSTYSIELLRLLLTASAEIDDLMKAFCRLLGAEGKLNSIEKYRNSIMEFSPGLIDAKAKCAKYDLAFFPWKDWEKDNSPSWWRDHNEVKHHRGSSYKLANLGNVLNAVSGLYLLNIHYNHVLMNKKMSYPLELQNTISQLRVDKDLFRVDDIFLYFKD